MPTMQTVMNTDNAARLALFDRRRKHYRLHRSGLSIEEVARRTGYPASTAADDIYFVAESGGYSEYGLGQRGRQAVFLETWADLDASKGEAWEAWFDSKNAQRKERVKRVENGETVIVETVTETTTSPGDPRFLGVVTDTAYKMAVLAGFVSDGQGGRATVGAADESDGEDDTVAIVEVGDRQQAAAVAGKRYCRLGVVEGVVVGRDESGAAVTVEAADGGESGG
jgi:hypothetical protein